MAVKSWIFGIGLMVVVLAATMGVRHASERANAHERAMKAEMERLRGELSSVQAATAALARAGMNWEKNREDLASEPGAPRAASSHAAVQHVALPTDPMEVLEAQRQRSRESVLRHAGLLDAFLSSDGVDAPWRDKTEAAIHTVLSGIDGTRLLETDCASHICKVRVEHDSRRDQKALAARISKTPPFDQEVFYHYDKEGMPPTTTVYMAREGASLATMVR